MKKRGFTLIELLAVIVVLAIIALIATPIILNAIRTSQKGSAERSAANYIGAVETWIATERLEGRTVEDGVYSIDEINAEASGTLPSEGWVEIKNGIVVDYSLKREDYVINYDTTKKIPVATNDGTLRKYEYKPIPELASGMLPVIYDGDNWKVVEASSKYYNYNNQEWANAVILKSGVTKNSGDIVDVANDAQAMFVYIPRYEYKIEGSYGKDGTSADLPGEIEVNFISKITTTASDGYRIHPAFTFGDKEVAGIWVGKFETTGSSTNPTILPDLQSLTRQTVSAQFTTAQKFNNYISGADAHMMKNSEWGAVAYLSQSKYGKYGNSAYSGANKEVYINNSSNLSNGGPYTGRSGGGPAGSTPINGTYSDQTSTAKYNIYGFYTYDGYLLEYNTNNKTATRDLTKVASTTGNITGIYDMSGGAFEYVMGYLSTASSTWGSTKYTDYAGFTSKPDSKYYDDYTTTTETTACSGGICYGHAISETSSWYKDYAYFSVSASNPWFLRGGYYNYGSNAGVFGSNNADGVGDPSRSFRVVCS